MIKEQPTTSQKQFAFAPGRAYRVYPGWQLGKGGEGRVFYANEIDSKSSQPRALKISNLSVLEPHEALELIKTIAPNVTTLEEVTALNLTKLIANHIRTFGYWPGSQRLTNTVLRESVANALTVDLLLQNIPEEDLRVWPAGQCILLDQHPLQEQYPDTIALAMISPFYTEEYANLSDFLFVQLTRCNTIAERLEWIIWLIDEFIELIEQLRLVYANYKVVHRDIKPENIIVADGKIKLTDFGISMIGAVGHDEACGTPATMAPDLTPGNGWSDRSDHFSIFAIIFNLLCTCVGISPDFLRRRDFYTEVEGTPAHKSSAKIAQQVIVKILERASHKLEELDADAVLALVAKLSISDVGTQIKLERIFSEAFSVDPNDRPANPVNHLRALSSILTFVSYSNPAEVRAGSAIKGYSSEGDCDEDLTSTVVANKAPRKPDITPELNRQATTVA